MLILLGEISLPQFGQPKLCGTAGDKLSSVFGSSTDDSDIGEILKTEDVVDVEETIDEGLGNSSKHFAIAGDECQNFLFAIMAFLLEMRPCFNMNRIADVIDGLGGNSGGSEIVKSRFDVLVVAVFEILRNVKKFHGNTFLA